MGNADSEGPAPLGPDDDIIWFARGRIAVLVPRTVTGGLEEAVRQISQRYEVVGQELALAVIIKDDMDRPGEEMRKGIRETLDRFAPMIVCNSIVVLGSGFFRGNRTHVSGRHRVRRFPPIELSRQPHPR